MATRWAVPPAHVDRPGDRAGDDAAHGQRPTSSRSARPSLVFAAVILVCTSLGLGLMNGVADGHLVDTDAYTWANRAVDLRYEGQWFDDTLRRVNPPAGLQQHWSRPFDVLLLVGGLVGEPFVGFTTALFGWAVILPCVLGLATLWLLWWGFSDLLDDAGRDAMALLFALQLTIVMGFMAGRSDHQALMGPLVVAIAALCRRGFGRTGDRRTVAVAGALSGFALWVGMEAALLLGGIAVAVTVQWVARDDEAISRLRVWALALTVSTCIALVAEHGIDGVLQSQLDELSITLVAAALVLAAGCAALERLHGRLGSPARRAAALVVVASVGLAALVGAFPAILGGPLGTVDPLYARTRLQYIGEIQPLVGPTLRDTVNLAVPGLSLLPLVAAYLIPQIRQPSRIVSSGLHLLLVPACVYLVMAIAQQRWLFPLNLLLVVPAALGTQRIMRAAAPAARRVDMGMIAIAAFAALWWLPFFALSVPALPSQCDIDDAVTALDERDSGAKVMAFTDHGPELLFRTSHSVMSIPNHRYQPGYTATYAAMAATESAAARDVLERNAVDLVLVCTNSAEAAFYGNNPAAFHARLAAGRPPDWMAEVPTPSTEPRFRLYEVAG